MKKNNNLNKIAKIISNLFNPGILGIIILLAAVYKSNMPQEVSITWYLAIIILNGLIPGLFYLFFTSRGFVFDDTLKNEKVHRERVLILVIFLTIASIELLIMASTNNFYQPLYAVLAGGILSLVIASIVSYFWKVSMHSSMITFFVLMVFLMFGYDAWPILILVPSVWWSRLVLARHTIWQLISGFLLSIIVVYLIFSYFNLINFS